MRKRGVSARRANLPMGRGSPRKLKDPASFVRSVRGQPKERRTKNATVSQAKIYKVSAVEICVLKIKPSQLVVFATGQVPSPGWRRPVLIPYLYISPPKDGIYDLDFVAESPAGSAAHVISPIAVTDIIPFSDGLRGVRIHSSTHAIVAMVNGAPNGPRGLAAMLVAATP